MGLLFSESATPKQKALICFIVTILSLSITGMVSDTLVNEKIGVPLAWLSIITSIILIAYLQILLCIKSSSFRKNIEAQGKALWRTRLPLIIIIPIFIYPSIFKAVPATAHLFSSTSGNIEVTVSKRGSSYSSKTCNGGVYLQEYSLFMNTQICGIHKEHWNKLSSGDQLRLYGQKSPFGFTFERYQVLTAH